MNSAEPEKHVVVIGAGIGGLSAALDLAAGGMRVTLVERQAVPGGKMREIRVGNHGIDSGPTVFTMRWVFDELFGAAGETFTDHVGLRPSEVLARHSWSDGSRLDLYPDIEKSAMAIGALAGRREADAYRRFARESEHIFDTLDHTFMRVDRPGPATLLRSLGFAGVPRLLATRPFTTLWRELGKQFHDPRLRQLFARYATYCGSSPFDSPATLMLIAHAERAGVWYVEGGMQRLAEALAAAAIRKGATIHYGTSVTRLLTDNNRVRAVELDNDSTLSADAVVFNGDVAALAQGLLGPAAVDAVPARSAEPRSLSAVTWSLQAAVEGFPLEHHTVFFGDDYVDEFESVFARKTITEKPTVYVCAQDRNGGTAADRKERLLLLVNAPPREFADAELEDVEARTFAHLEQHGLTLSAKPGAVVRTSPNDYADRFPGSDGAIYGWPTHGWSGSFRRSGSRCGLRGLYLAGGTVHPGPGVPMTALSGRIAANCVRDDLLKN